MLLGTAVCVFAADKEFRAGWLEFVRPAIAPDEFPTAFHYHRARERAIASMKLSLENKKRAETLESLAYFYLRDFQYQNAREGFEEALKRKGDEPRLRHLLGQTKAVLLLAEPETRSEECKEAIKEFRRAADREESNAMPLFQAASVAFDSNRSDLALPLVKEALGRPECGFYTLPVPEDLAEDRAQATGAWWWVQSELWKEMIVRAANCGRWVVRQADRSALRGEKEKAEELYLQAVQIGQHLYRTNPPLVEALAAGLEMERTALRGRLRNPAGDSADVEERLKRLDSAQKNLERLWRDLREKERRQPPASIEERVENQKRLVEAILSSL